MIREATLNDIDKGLLDVYVEGYRYHQKGRPDIFTITDEEELRKKLIDTFQKSLILVITDNDKVVGILIYEIKSNINKKIHVSQLVIKEEYRGKGFGKKLMDKLEVIARENNCHMIELDCWLFNESAMAMYEHIGFDRQRIMYEKKVK